VDSWAISTTTLEIQGLASTLGLVTQGFDVAGDMRMYADLFTSTLTASAAALAGIPFVSGDSGLIFGSTVANAGSFGGSISTLGDLFNRGSISSKNGAMYVGGDVTLIGSFRGQRGQQITVNEVSTISSATFKVPLYTYSTMSLTSNCVGASMLSDTMNGETLNAQSAVSFSPTVYIHNTPGSLVFTGVPITVPSSISSGTVVVTDTVATSNLIVNNFADMASLQYLTLGSTHIANDEGSLIVSSIEGNSFLSQSIYGDCLKDTTTFATNTITMNDEDPSVLSTIISYNGAIISTPLYWSISSLGTNGTFTAPFTDVSANWCIIDDTRVGALATGLDNFIYVNTGRVDISGTVEISGNIISMKNVIIDNTGGTIVGTHTEIVQDIYCYSLQTNLITSPSTIGFKGASIFTLPDTFVSTITMETGNTSSLAISQIVAGSSAEYSTINSSTCWLNASTFSMNAPFTKTTGIGTYFNPTNFVAASDQTAYYSIINPIAQVKQALTTPYVNTVVGTGIQSMPTDTSGQNIGVVVGPAAVGADGSLYFGAGDAAGWKLKQLTPQGILSTLAGQPRYFYGDGGYPTNAALSPRLSLSLFTPGTLLITDISNVRLRYVSADPIITTIAGYGQPGFSGDGDLPTAAAFSTPRGTLATSYGSTIYLADSDNKRIRIITGSTISTFAGTGASGAEGDGGQASLATLSGPYALATDAFQNIIFTDVSNCVVRSIAPDGTIDRIAGTYASGYTGDGGLATAATLSYPTGITVDPFNAVYICDTSNACVRRIDPITQVITTVAGNGVAGYGGDGGLAVSANLSSPTGVSTDAAGNLYIADRDNQCIRFVSIANGKIGTVAGRPLRAGYSGDNSFATYALLNTPTGVVYDTSTDYFFIADQGNNAIRYVDTRRKIIRAAVGNGSPISAGDGGPPAAAVFGNITSVATDSHNNIYISDGRANRIRQINLATSTIQTVVGTGVAGFGGDGGLAAAAYLSSPQTLLFDAENTLYFTDMMNQRVRSVDGATSTIHTIAGTGVAGYNGDGISSITAELNSPAGLTLGADGSLYVADTLNYRIRKVSPSGLITTFAGSGNNGQLNPGDNLATTSFGLIGGLAIQSSIVVATDATTSAIWSFDPQNNIVNNLSALSTPAYLGDAGPLLGAFFNEPTGLTYDPSGNLIICDTGNFRIRKTYTFGFPQNPLYLTMNMAYTNYLTTDGMATIKLNGNVLTTFSAAAQSNQTYQIMDLPVLNYPLQSSNPVTGDQVPFLEIMQQGSTGYVKLAGNFWVEQVPGQGLLTSVVDSNSGIFMNQGSLIFPNQLDTITIDNKYNDASLRTISYTGSLISASDPALKEEVETADLARCYQTLRSLPLRTYSYIEPYVSTFQVNDAHRLGFLTTEVRPFFPNSISRIPFEGGWASSIDTLDTAQIKCAHFGVTQYLMSTIETLESEAGRLASTLRTIQAQRKSIS
jgi:sugar lactone lactonase YvrE